MARIRTIKPEFPQSESIGRLSREARLLYIMLFTIVDDAGRARASSRMLASLLYPYDDDAAALMDGWLAELEQGVHIRRYEVDGSQYLEIVKWLEHQKIDKPSKSRLPEFSEGSRIVAKPREASARDLGPRTGTLDLGPPTVVVVEDRVREPAKPLLEKPRVSPEKQAAIALGLAFLNAAGFKDHADAPMNWYGISDRAAIWISNGWPETMILAETRIAVGRGGPPNSLKYFEAIFATAAARAAQPTPTVNVRAAENIDVVQRSAPGDTGSNRSVGAAFAEITRRLEQNERGAGSEGGGGSSRLLAQG